MAKKTTTKDLTKYGSEGLKGVRNSDIYGDLSARVAAGDPVATAYMNSLSAPNISLGSGVSGKGYFYGEDETDPAWNKLGKSSYDSPYMIGGDPTDIDENRAERQSWITQLSNGVLKGAVTAGTTILDGTVGLLTGLGTGIYNRLDDDPNTSFNGGFFNNEVSKALRATTKAMEEYLPNYRTQDEIENPWALRNITSMNTFADDFLKNLGFTVGAFYSGAAWLGGLKALGLAKGALSSQVVGSVLSGFNEGRIEAGNLYDEMVSSEMQNLDREREKIKQERLQSPEVQAQAAALTQEYESQKKLIEAEPDSFTPIEGGGFINNKQQKLLDLSRLYKNNIEQLEKSTMADVDARYDKMKQNILNRADSAAAADMWLNTILLTGTNMYAYGKLYARGFKNKKDLAGRTKGSRKEGAYDRAVREAEAEETFGERVVRADDGTYATKDVTNKQAAWRGLKTSLSEGAEEINQAGIASFSSNYYQPDSPDAYYKALLNDNYEVKTKDGLTALTTAFGESWGDPGAWKEGAIGFLTGFLGMPTFGKVKNSDHLTWLGRGKSIGFSGGMIGEITNAAYLNQQAHDAVTTMNKFAKKVNDGKEIFTRSQSFTNAIDGFAEEGDAFEFKNAEDNDMFNAIDAFSRTGRLDDLREMVNQDFENITDERLKEIADSTSGATNEWVDPNNGASLADSETGRQQMREKLKKKRDTILEDINDYEDALLTMRSIGNNSLSDDQVRELAWLKWKIGKFDKRLSTIKEEKEPLLRKLEEELTKRLDEGFGTDEYDESLPISREAFERQQSVDRKNVEVIRDYIRELLKSKSALELSSKTWKNESLIDALGVYAVDYNLGDFELNDVMEAVGEDVTATRELVTALKDSGKMAIAAKTFNDRLKEFTDDPIKLIQNRERLQRESQSANNAAREINHRETIANSTIPQLINMSRDPNSGINLDDLLNTFRDDEAIKSKLQTAKNVRDAHTWNSQALERELAAGASNQTVSDAMTLLDHSLENANSVEELEDLNSSVYNNPSSLGNEEPPEGVSPQEYATALNTRNDQARNLLQKVFTDRANAASAVQDVPGRAAGPVRTGGERGTTRGTDPVDRTESETERAAREARERAAQDSVTENEKLAEQLIARFAPGSLDADEKEALISPLRLCLDNMDTALRSGLDARATAAAVKSQPSYQNVERIAGEEAAKKMLNEAYRLKTLQNQQVDVPNTDTTNNDEENNTNSQAAISNPSELVDSSDKQYNSNPNASENDEAAQLGYWKPTTTEIPIHAEKGSTTPLWETSAIDEYTPEGKQRVTAVGQFLMREGAFNVVNAGIPVGTVIRFMVDKKLNEDAGEVVILMIDPSGRVVGDLMSKKSPAIYRQNGLKEFIEKCEAEFNEKVAAGDTSDRIILTPTTSVAQNLVGKVHYTSGGTLVKFPTGVQLGIAMTGGRNAVIRVIPGRTRAQGRSGIEKSVMSPLNAVTGAPYILIETSDPNRKYIPIPFFMPVYSATDHANTALGKAIASVVESIKTGNQSNAVKIKNALQELLYIPEVHINYDTGGNVKVTIKNRGDEHQTTIYNGPANSDRLVDTILQRLSGTQFSICKKYINTTYRGTDYNSMIAEVASCDVASPHTIGDWFTINPIDSEGKEVKATKIKTTRTNPAAAAPSASKHSITVNGINLEVNTETWEVSDENGKVYNGRNTDKVRAHAFGEVKHKDMSSPYQTQWGYYDPVKREFIQAPTQETPEVIRKLGVTSTGITNSDFKDPGMWSIIESQIDTLTADQLGELERILSEAIASGEIVDTTGSKIALNEEEKNAAESLHTKCLRKLNSLNTEGASAEPPTSVQLSKEELTTLAEDQGLLSTSTRKKLWGTLNEQQMSGIVSAEEIVRDQWMDELEFAWDKRSNSVDSSKISSESLRSLFDDSPRTREVTESPTPQEGIDKELEWLAKVLPGFTRDNRVRLVNGIIRVSKNGNPVEAWGTFLNGIITLSRNAARGTVYHEAFHAVVGCLLTEEERVNLFSEAAKYYSKEIKSYGNPNAKDLIEVEELLAEDFRRYIEGEQVPIIGTIRRFFRTLKHFIQRLTGREPFITSVFYNISRGNYSQRTIKKAFGNQTRTRAIERDAKQLVKDVETFLGNFAITLKDVSEYDGELPLFDAIDRVVNFTSIEDLTDGVGEAIATMMQHQKPMQDLISLDINFGRNLKGLKRLLRRYQPEKSIIFGQRIPKDVDVKPSLKRIGAVIAEELRKFYDVENNKEPSFLRKIWEVIAEFFNILNYRNKIIFESLHQFAKHIVNNVAQNDATLILRGMVKPGTDTKAERVNIPKAFEENPYEEQIISFLSSKGIALAGSASIALHGYVFRPKENPLHDIDFSAPGFSKEQLDEIVQEISPFNSHIRTITSEGSLTETYLVLDREFTTQQNGFHIKKDPETGKEKRIPLFDIKDSDGNLIGRYYASELTLVEGVKGKFLDFFRTKSTYGSSTMDINGKRYLISDPRNAWEAKLKWARLKDIWDYNRYAPNGFNSYVVRDDTSATREEIRKRVSTSNIIWGHPALGKTTYIESHRGEIIEWDEEVNPRRSEFVRNQIDPEHKMDTSSQEYNELKSTYMATPFDHPEYISFLTREWEALKEKAAAEGKKIFASPLPLLQLFPQDFDLVINLGNYEFSRRNMQRGGSFYGTLSWKVAIDETIAKFDKDRVVDTNDYFSDIMANYSDREISAIRAQRDRDKLMYENLSAEDKQYLEDRRISIEEYNEMTDEEKDVLFHCKA